jgi:hypothetical protein
MSVLDLQILEEKEETSEERRPSGSRSSKGCGNNSGFSLLLC